jgi:tetratricopeptide (TPR) repeat protein
MLDIVRILDRLRLRRPITWVYVTVGIALSGAAAHFLQSRFLSGLESAHNYSTAVVEDWNCQRRKASVKLSDDVFTMLVSRLQGDANGTKTEKISFALAKGGFQLLQICQSLQIDVGNELITEQINAIERGKALVKEWRADLIIFGKVMMTDNSLLIWTVNQHGGCDSSLAPTKLKDDAQTAEFEREAKAKLLAAVLKEIAAACRHGDDMDWELFKRQMKKLTALIAGTNLDLKEDQLLDISESYYNGLNLLYHWDGDNTWFELASSYAKYEREGTGTDLRKTQATYFYGRALTSKWLKAHDNDAGDQAIKVLEEALRGVPANVPGWRTEILDDLTRAYTLKGNDVLALKQMDEAIRINPGDPGRLNDRCYLQAKIGRLKAALDDCNESLKLRPNERATLDSRGVTYLKLKQSDKAIKDFDAVLRLDPKNARALYGRGVAQLISGNKNQGTGDIAAAKAIQPDVADEFARYGIK